LEAETLPEQAAAKTKSWGKFYSPDYEYCKEGCKLLALAPGGHGSEEAAGGLYYDPSFNDGVAKWGDCVGEIFACIEGQTALVGRCVAQSSCPEDCKEYYDNASGPTPTASMQWTSFRRVFVDTGGYCTP
jgi:hypothetical protein